MRAGKGPLRSKRRPKRRRETRTTSSDRRREAPQRTASCLSEAARTTHVRRAAPARVRERASSPVTVDAGPGKGFKKSRLRACCTCRAADDKQPILKYNTTPDTPVPAQRGDNRGSVARPTLHRPHERALAAAESRGRIELAVLQERAYLNDIHTRVSQVDGGRGEQCGGHRVPCF